MNQEAAKTADAKPAGPETAVAMAELMTSLAVHLLKNPGASTPEKTGEAAALAIATLGLAAKAQGVDLGSALDNLGEKLATKKAAG